VSLLAGDGRLVSMASPTRFRALFEDGICKQLAEVELPDRAEGERTVLDRRAFEAWWSAHVKRVQRRVGDVSSMELDIDVDTAIGEVRAQGGMLPFGGNR